MSRGILDDPELARVSQKLPNLEHLQKAVLGLSPDLISTQFARQSTVPVAAVCLQDSVRTLAEAWYALHEFFAHGIWYLEKEDPPNKRAAAFFSRFYAEDVALRLYSAGEHLAYAIIFMLEITEEQLDSYRRNRISRQSIVGRFLTKEMPQHPITEAVARLASSEEWCNAMRYRNTWVHEQPPTVEGLGIVYRRSKRWRGGESAGGYVLSIGGGDASEYSVDDLAKSIQPALSQFSDAVTDVVGFYIELLRSRGITVSQADHSLQIRF